MMKNIDTLIEQYIQGNMSLEEATNFEELMSQNPEIKSEVSMQQNIIEAIKETRRIELKTKLMQINPNTISPLTQKIAIAAATFAISALVGIGIYSVSLKSNNTVANPIIESSNVEIVNLNTPTESKSATSPQEKEDVIEEVTVKTSTSSAPSNTNKTIVAKESNVSQKTNQSKVFDPTKQFLNTKDEKELTSDEDLPLEKQNSTNKQEVLEIHTDENYSYLGYQYDGKVISLHGKYTDPYIIVERAGMRVLKYQDKSYRIVSSGKSEKLENHLISDPEILEKLK